MHLELDLTDNQAFELFNDRKVSNGIFRKIK